MAATQSPSAERPALPATEHAAPATEHEAPALEAPPLQVQVNDPSNAAAVEAFFKSRKQPIKLVSNITSDSYVQVSLNLESQQGSNCKVFVVASNRGMYVQYPAYKSVDSLSKAQASTLCQKFLAESISNALRMVF